MNAHLFPFTDPVAAEAEPPKEMVRGNGIHAADAQGSTYLDTVSGLWCASLWLPPERL